jgi:hypothetical protein
VRRSAGCLRRYGGTVTDTNSHEMRLLEKGFWIFTKYRSVCSCGWWSNEGYAKFNDAFRSWRLHERDMKRGCWICGKPPHRYDSKGRVVCEDHAVLNG